MTYVIKRPGIPPKTKERPTKPVYRPKKER